MHKTNNQKKTAFFPKERKLCQKEDYRRSQYQGKRINIGKLTFYIHHNGFSYPRLGVIVAKKNYPKAHQRNYLKRIMRENFRNNQTLLDGHDIVVIVHRIKNKQSRTETFNEIAGIWYELVKYLNKDLPEY